MKRCKQILFLVLVMILAFAPSAMAAKHSIYKPGTAEMNAMNAFLTAFTEMDSPAITSTASSADLIQFYYNHLWYSDYQAFASGDYAGGNNYRVSDARVQEIVGQFFYNPMKVDLYQSEYDYDGKYFYNAETGGRIRGGFAITTSIYSLGNDKYFVSYMTFGEGEYWSEAQTKLTLNEAWSKFGDPVGFGSALICADNLKDADTYRMISFSPA